MATEFLFVSVIAILAVVIIAQVQKVRNQKKVINQFRRSKNRSKVQQLVGISNVFVKPNIIINNQRGIGIKILIRNNSSKNQSLNLRVRVFNSIGKPVKIRTQAHKSRITDVVVSQKVNLRPIFKKVEWVMVFLPYTILPRSNTVQELGFRVSVIRLKDNRLLLQTRRISFRYENGLVELQVPY